VLGELDQLGQRRVLERLHDAALHTRPEQACGAVVEAVQLVVAEDAPAARLGEALHRRERPLERRDDLRHRDLPGGTVELVAAMCAARRAHEAGLPKTCDEMLQIGKRKPLGVGDLRQRNGSFLTTSPKHDHHSDSVLGSG
jgi:hypothetical protein